MRQDNKIQVRLVSVSEVKFMLNLDEALLAKSEPNGPNIGFAHAISVNKEESMMCTPKFGLINNSDSMSSVLYRAHVV